MAKLWGEWREKTRTSARQTKQLSATKAIQVAFDKHGEKIIHHKGTAEEVKMVIPWDFVHSRNLKIVNYNMYNLFVKQCILLII